MPKKYGSRHRSIKWTTKINKMRYGKIYITTKKYIVNNY